MLVDQRFHFSFQSNSKVVRSNSVNQVRGGVDEFVFKPMQWHRSKSTTRLNIAMSNVGGGGSSSGGGSNSTDDEIQMTILPSDEFGQILVDNYFIENGAGLPQASPNPPNYDETISRQRILRYYRRPEGSVSVSASPRHYQESSSQLNAHHHLASLSINDGFRSKSDLSAPPPLPPKERPPLPPKQRYVQRSSVGSIHDNTYANMSPFYPRYDDDDDLYTATYNNLEPPNLPPKEPKSSSSASSSLSTAATQTLSMCDAETQTNEDDFFYPDDVDDDISFRDDLSFEQSVDAVLHPDDRMSAHLYPSPRESPRSSTLSVALPKWSASPRPYQPMTPQHQPPQQQPQPHRLFHTSSHHHLFQPPHQQQQQQPQPQLLQQHHPHVVPKENLHGEKISWSVSQLRSLFNQDRSESGETNAAAYPDQHPHHQPLVRDSGGHPIPIHRSRYRPQVGGKDRSPSAAYTNNNSHFSDDNSDEESYV